MKLFTLVLKSQDLGVLADVYSIIKDDKSVQADFSSIDNRPKRNGKRGPYKAKVSSDAVLSISKKHVTCSPGSILEKVHDSATRYIKARKNRRSIRSKIVENAVHETGLTRLQVTGAMSQLIKKGAFVVNKK